MTASALTPAIPSCARAISASPRWRSAPASCAGRLGLPRRGPETYGRLAGGPRRWCLSRSALWSSTITPWCGRSSHVPGAPGWHRGGGGGRRRSPGGRARGGLLPDVILMDLVMPRLDGFGAMRELRTSRDAPGDGVTSPLDDERLMPALQAGAAGYLLKDVEPAELARAVRSAYADEALIDPTVAGRLLRKLSDDAASGPAPAATPSSGSPGGSARSSSRSRRALQQADRARARRSPRRRSRPTSGHLLAKLGVADRTQAALFAVQHGLTGGSP